MARGRARPGEPGRRDAEATEVSLAAAPGWGPPGGAGRGARAERARRAARASCCPRPGWASRLELPSAGRERDSGSPDGLTWRWIELHHLPCLDLFCSRFGPAAAVAAAARTGGGEFADYTEETKT